MDSDTLTFLHNVLRSIFLPCFKSPQFTSKMTRSHSTIFSFFYLICWLHAALYCVQLWECGVEQCKDLIKHHQGTFNYQRLAELHVSGWGGTCTCQHVIVSTSVQRVAITQCGQRGSWAKSQLLDWQSLIQYSECLNIELLIVNSAAAISLKNSSDQYHYTAVSLYNINHPICILCK